MLLHARQEAFCGACRSHVVRTVWDGDQVLHEVSAPASGAGTEMDVQPTLESFMGPKHFGRAMYVHAGAIDYPLAVVRTYPLSNHKSQRRRGLVTASDP